MVVMFCIEVSVLFKLCISIEIKILLEHEELVLVLHGIGQNSVMVFMSSLVESIW